MHTSPTVPTTPGASPEAEGETLREGEAKALRLMIVEDDAIGALFLEQLLQDLGHEVCAVADSAASAVAAAGEARPDFVLMDVRLAQGSDGIEAAHEINDRFGIGSVFLTAHSDAATLRRARARSEEHTSELQSLMRISYAVFC